MIWANTTPRPGSSSRCSNEAGYRGEPGRRLLDPACGSGAFLVAAIARICQRQSRPIPQRRRRPPRWCRRLCEAVVGLDLNPLAVLTARANYLIALGDLAPRAELADVEIPVHLCDAILDGPAPGRDGPESFDYVVGNPPWIAWDQLPGGLPRGHQAALGKVWPVLALRQRGPAWRRQEGSFDADDLRRAPTATSSRMGGWPLSSPKPSFKPAGPATAFAASAWGPRATG